MQDTINTDLPFSFVPHWVTDSDISDRALRLYSVLAKFADSKTGQAFPGRTRLSRELKCSPKSVDRAVKELENIGAIRKTQRVKDGRYQSSLYTVVRVDPKTHQTRPRVTHDATPGHGWDDPVSPVTQRTITTELEPKQLEPLNSLFDQFWSIYPKKADKPVARRAFEKALKRTTAEVILNGAQSYRDDPNREQRFTKNPSSWLNADAWENEPLPSKEKLANWQKAVLLSQKYAEESQNEVEQVNRRAVAELEAETTSWLKGVDDE